MGLAASMRVLPADLYEQYKDTTDDCPSPEACGARFSLDRAWQELHEAFRGMPKPLPLAVSGDRPFRSRLDDGLLRGGNPDSDEEWDENEEDCYFGYASPALVKKLDRALEQLSEDEVLAAITAAGWDCTKKSDQKYYLSAFKELRKAYRTAAPEGAALLIVIT